MKGKKTTRGGTARRGKELGGREGRTAGVITKALIGSLAGGLIVTIATIWGAGLRHVLEAFSHASGALITAYLVVSVLIAVGVTYRWRIALAAFGAKLPFYALFIYRLIGFAVAYVTPAAHVGGDPVRAMLVGKQGIPYRVSFSAVIVDYSLELLFNITFFFIGALIIANKTSFPLIARITIFTLSIVLVAAATLFVTKVFRKKKVFVPILKALRFQKRKGWKGIEKSVGDVEILIEHFYHNRRGAFAKMILINAILWLLMFIEYKVALLILGYEASLTGIFLLLTGIGLAYSIPIPAALGVLELGQVTAGALLGIRAAVGVALAFLIRARDIAWTIIGLLLLGVFHHNFLNLYERSRRVASQYNLRTLDQEVKKMLRTTKW